LDLKHYSEVLAYIKANYHYHYIEGSIFTYITQGLLTNKPVSQITPNIFLAEKYVLLHSYIDELDRLLKAKI
jgi:hypothetical protein